MYQIHTWKVIVQNVTLGFFACFSVYVSAYIVMCMQGQNLCPIKLLSVSCLHSEGLKASEHGMPVLMCVFASAGVGYTTPHTSARFPLTTTKDSGKQVSQIRAFPVVLKPGSGLQWPLFSCPSQFLSLSHAHTHTCIQKHSWRFDLSATFSLSLTHILILTGGRKRGRSGRCLSPSAIYVLREASSAVPFTSAVIKPSLFCFCCPFSSTAAWQPNMHQCVFACDVYI